MNLNNFLIPFKNIYLAISEQEMQSQLIKANQLEKEWRKRRRAWMEIVDILWEATGQRPKELMEKVGVETDEEHNLVLPPK